MRVSNLSRKLFIRAVLSVHAGLLSAIAFLTVFHLPVQAQSAVSASAASEKNDSIGGKKQRKIKDGAGSNFARSEVDEAILYLNEIKDRVNTLKIYKLAETDRSMVAPQIADLIVTSGEKEKRFQKTIEKVLRFHNLSEVCRGVLFENENPTIYTYKLRVISFSTGIFDKQTDDEAAALIAHEVGHVYLAKELADARRTKDDRAARIAELKCDAVALITLKNLKIDPAIFIKALNKLIEARENLNLGTSTEQSALLADRVKLAEYLVQKFK